MSSTRRMKKKKKQQLKSSLPEEIILEILVRLPVQALIRFKCVSKSWRSLISSSDFTKSHSQMCAPRKRVLLILISSLYPLNYNSSKPITAEFYHTQFAPDLTRSFNFMIVLGSCNHSVCMFCKFFSGQYVILLYNQSTKMYRSIALPSPPSELLKMECLGFGFVSDGQEYMVDRQVWDHLRSGKFQVQVLHLLETETVGPEISCDYRVENGSIAVSLNGSIHWLRLSGASSRIVCLDLARQVFDEMPLPLPHHESGWYRSLVTLDGCLSLFQRKKKSSTFVLVLLVFITVATFVLVL